MNTNFTVHPIPNTGMKQSTKMLRNKRQTWFEAAGSQLLFKGYKLKCKTEIAHYAEYWNKKDGFNKVSKIYIYEKLKRLEIV